jgi:hypothetical protein
MWEAVHGHSNALLRATLLMKGDQCAMGGCMNSPHNYAKREAKEKKVTAWQLLSGMDTPAGS